MFYKKVYGKLAVIAVSALVLSGCGSDLKESATTGAEEITEESTASQVAGEGETVAPVEVVEDWMIPIYADELNDGSYEITMSSSSSMFKVTACTLTVENGEMRAVLTMSGTAYTRLYLGTAEEAAAADEADYILNDTDEDGAHIFTIPVSALDEGIKCAAYSQNKEKWYDRTILFRSDSLDTSALKEDSYNTVESLELEDGTYTAAVTLEGGSGKTTVDTPAAIEVRGGEAFATIVFSSPNYDYMIVDGEKYLPINEDGNSTFKIPVAAFDKKLSVTADTVAMSTPHEIEYTLCFDSSTLE